MATAGDFCRACLQLARSDSAGFYGNEVASLLARSLVGGHRRAETGDGKRNGKENEADLHDCLIAYPNPDHRVM